MPSFFRNSGVREVNFVFDKKMLIVLTNEWKAFVSTINDYPIAKYRGRGIVICSGGLTYFTCAWVAIKNLRRVGCNLPIEWWYLGDELSEEVILNLKSQNVICKNFLDFGETKLRGVMLKPLAIILSQFRDILFLDADNNSLVDPTFLFKTEEYLKFGAVFWPDYWQTAADNPIWKIIKNKYFQSKEFDSGQMLINKEKCWKELNLCLFFNQQSDIYYLLLHGDKDTFKYAWLALGSKFYLIPKEPAVCGFRPQGLKFIGNTMVQHSVDGSVLFLHRNLHKWHITHSGEMVWQKIKSFPAGALKKVYILSKHDMDLDGDYKESDSTPAIMELEQCCLEILSDLRRSDFYGRFITYSALLKRC